MNILVVTTADGVEHALRGVIGEDDSVKVVVPAVRQGVMGWLANDQSAYDEAQAMAEETAGRLPADDASSEVGEADVELAIRDALATFPADEIIVALRPEEQAGRIEAAAAGRFPRGEIDGIPIRVVVARTD
jgi:hypothetical protein